MQHHHTMKLSTRYCWIKVIPLLFDNYYILEFLHVCSSMSVLPRYPQYYLSDRTVPWTFYPAPSLPSTDHYLLLKCSDLPLGSIYNRLEIVVPVLETVNIERIGVRIYTKITSLHLQGVHVSLNNSKFTLISIRYYYLKSSIATTDVRMTASKP